MKKSTKTVLFAVGASVAAIYAYNKYVEITATRKNLLRTEDGEFFPWKSEDIYYTKTGHGSPILLLHDANPSSSAEEWSKIVTRLSQHHTVYCVDLVGCGRSSKPNIEYTNFYYVQMITAFINEVIQEKTSLVATNMSASFAIMTNHMNPGLIDKMVLINPVSLKQLDITPDKQSKAKKTLIQIPFIGTFVYNVLTSNVRIDKEFRTQYYAKPQLVPAQIRDTYYESAHTGGSNGRYLFSSLLGNYVNNTVKHAVIKNTTPTLIIGCKEIANYEKVLNEYQRANDQIEIVRLHNATLYPQLEIPEKVENVISNFIA